MRVLYPSQIGISSVSFRGGRKTGEPGEKPSEQGENQQHSYSMHIWHRARIKPGPHCGSWRALLPLHHPCSPQPTCT